MVTPRKNKNLIKKVMRVEEYIMSSWQYNATIIKVYDGDTVTAEVDLGFSVKMKMTLRLLDIDAPEIRGEEREEGLKSRDWLREKILGKEVVIQTKKDRKGKYGRYLATIYEGGENINIKMLQEGYAKEYK